MVVVQPPTEHARADPGNAPSFLDHSVFLPLYKPMPSSTMDKIATAVIEGDRPQEAVPT